LLDLGLKRRGDHPPSALPGEIIQRDRRLTSAALIDPANISHGVPSFPALGRSVLINREGTPPSSSHPSTTSGYSSLKLLDLVGEELALKKADSALKNYKLKVSRLATCFSMVANLSAEPVPVTVETVLELCRMTPAERFERLRPQGQIANELIDQLFEIYDAFLDSTRRDKDDLLAEFTDSSHREQALGDAKRYGDLIYKLLQEVASAERMRFLVI
jgi:hypothetical protein